MLAVGPPAVPITTDVVEVQPFPSAAETVYVPAPRPLAEAAEPPLGAQLYVYPEPVPPEADTVAVPVLEAQPLGVEDANDTETAVAGCEIVTMVEVVQPLLSVIVTV